MDKQDAQNGVGADLNNVKNLVNLLLRFGSGLVAPYASTAILSAVSGLGEGLSKGLSEHDLIGGVLDGARGLVDGLAKGGISGFGDYFTSLLTL